MNVDKLYLGAIQLKDPIKNIPNHDEDLHLANHKVENVQKLIEEQEQKVAHTSGKNMSLLSMFGTVVFVVFFFVFCVVVVVLAVVVRIVGCGL